MRPLALARRAASPSSYRDSQARPNSRPIQATSRMGSIHSARRRLKLSRSRSCPRLTCPINKPPIEPFQERLNCAPAWASHLRRSYPQAAHQLDPRTDSSGERTCSHALAHEGSNALHALAEVSCLWRSDHLNAARLTDHSSEQTVRKPRLQAAR